MTAEITITSLDETSFMTLEVTEQEFKLLKRIESGLIQTDGSPEFHVRDFSQIESERKAAEAAMRAAESKQLAHALGQDVESKSAMQTAFEKAMKKSK